MSGRGGKKVRNKTKFVNFSQFTGVISVTIALNFLAAYRYDSDGIAVLAMFLSFVVATLIRINLVSVPFYGLLLLGITLICSIISYHRKSGNLILTTIILSNLWFPLSYNLLSWKILPFFLGVNIIILVLVPVTKLPMQFHPV